jgi:hypothetical protein
MLRLSREYQIIIGGIATSSFLFDASAAQSAKIYKERIKVGRFSFEKNKKIICCKDNIDRCVGQWKYIKAPQFLFTCSDRGNYTNKNTVIVNAREMNEFQGFNELFDFHIKILKNIAVSKNLIFELVPTIDKVMSNTWLLVFRFPYHTENLSIVEYGHKDTGIVSMIIPPAEIFWNKNRRVTTEERNDLFLPMSEKIVGHFGGNVTHGTQIQGTPNQNIFPRPDYTRIETTKLKNIYREPTDPTIVDIDRRDPRLRDFPTFTITNTTNTEQDRFFDTTE